MKLKQFLLIALSITFFTCNTESVDNPDEETTDSTLIKKIVYDKGTSDEYTATFNYDGNKLISVDAGDGYITKYIYENDKLVRINDLESNDLHAYVTIQYNIDEKIGSYIIFFEKDNDHAEKHIFTYNSDNTMTESVYYGTYAVQETFSYSSIITFEGKNIMNEKWDDDDIEYIYTYDDKKGALRNIQHIDIINLISVDFGGLAEYGSVNNVTSLKEIQDGTVNYFDEYEYIYDNNGYPKTSIYKTESRWGPEEDTTMDYFYE